MIKSKNITKIANRQELKSIIYNKAIVSYPSYWSSRKNILDDLIDKVFYEIEKFEEVGSMSLSFSEKEAKDILAVWSISGSGSLTKDFISSPSDDKYRNKDWYAGTDRIRLRCCEKAILSIAKAKSGQKEISSGEEARLIKEYGPYLIYNGISEQINTLLEESGKTFIIPKENIYIPAGKIVKTLDQIKNFSMPPDISGKKGHLIIVSHSPHLSRILRFMKKHEHKFNGLTIKVLPISAGGSTDFIEAELSGILDYIAMGESAYEPIIYSIN